MKNYLSYGGGVNSTAMLILMHNEGIDFEAVYVDHGCDWPETAEYVKMVAEKFPITIIKPKVGGWVKHRNGWYWDYYNNLYDYCWYYEMVPFFSLRFCTAKFKVRVMQDYVKTPCFQYLGIGIDEAHRAKLKGFKGAENRFPLIEHEIDRDGCKKIIKDYGLPVPMKSGCWFCVFQRIGEWKKLRRLHPDLFCKAQQLELRNMEYRKRAGKAPFGLIGRKTLSEAIKEGQEFLFKDMEYPPCNCGL